MRAIFAAALCTFASAACAADDEFCAHFRRFETAPFAPGETARSVEVVQQNFSLRCAMDGDKAQRDFCAWLSGHISAEFPDVNVRMVMSCYGVSWPAGHMGWTRWQTEAELPVPEPSRRITLVTDLDFSKPFRPQTFRLTVEPKADTP